MSTSVPGLLPAMTDDAPMAARCVRALLDRHGLPRYRQSAWLADAMKLSYSQAHRRLTGASIWTLEDLAQVAALLGESLAQLVTLQPGATTSVTGVMRVGNANLDCQLWLGDVIEQPAPDTLVAVRTSTGWTALVASEATEGAAYLVERLEAKPAAAATRKSIAVLDDDADLTLSVCAHLEASGFSARPFYKIADLLTSALAGPHVFDAFVIDWIVGEASTVKLIAALREQNLRAPILVLTAQMLSGRVDESEIAEAVRTYDLIFSEKPIRMPILSASLTRAFAAAATPPSSPAPDTTHASLP